MAAREPTPDAFRGDFNQDSSTLSAEDLSGNNAEWPLARFTSYKAEILDDLGFKEFLQQNTDRVIVNFDSGKIQGSEEGIGNAIKKFEMEIYTDLIKFKDMPGISRLFCDKDGLIIEQIEGYIKKVLFENKITNFHLKCYSNDTYDDMLSVLVSCRSRDEAVKAKTLIETHICSFSLSSPSSGVKNVISEWQKKCKLVQTEGEDGVVIITCTQDVKEKIEAEEKKRSIKRIEMSSLRAKYLAKHKDIIETVSKNFGVKIDLDPGSCSIRLEGIIFNIKLAMNSIKSKLNSETVNVSTFPSKSLVSELDRIAEEQDCVWEVKKDSPSTNIPGEIENCDYVATWYDPTKPGTFTVIEGDTHDINVDCLIVLCTDSLFPLQFEPDADRMKSIMNHMEKNIEPHNVGKILLTQATEKTYTTELHIVIGKSNTEFSKENKTFSGLTARFKRIFKEILERQWKTVCMPAYIQEGFLTTDNIVNAYVEAAIETQMSGCPLQLYLYCEREKRVLNEHLLETINRIYSKQPGFSRQLIQQDMEMKDWGRLSEVEVEVQVEYIQKMRTEIIVNTTSTSLELDKGYVSSKLLQLAGMEMQQSCRAKHPDGIGYRTICVTDSYGLKETNRYLNHVFHGVLPQFRRETYIQDVKTFMRCCLSEADKRKCKSIAFPALGTGKLCYPVRQVAKAMFDAVEEYSQESVCPYVERVVFSLYHGDESICKIFQREYEERKAKNNNWDTKKSQEQYKKVPLYGSILKGTLSGQRHPVEVNVGLKEDFGPMKDSVIQIKLYSAYESTVKLRYSNDNPVTRRDQLLISYHKKESQPFSMSFPARESEDARIYKTCIRDAIQFCVKNNIAEFSIDIDAGLDELDYETKVKSILDEIETGIEGKAFVLHTVFVRLSTAEQFEKLKSKFMKKISLQTVKNVFNTVVDPLGTKLKWEVIDSRLVDSELKIKIIGETTDAVLLTKQKMEDSIKALQLTNHQNKDSDVDRKWYNEKQGARPKQLPKLVSQPSGQEELSGRNLQDTDNSYWTDDTEYGVPEEALDVNISAEVNEGFIKFKEKFHDFQRWKILVEAAYNVTLDHESISDEDSIYKVKGTYRQVMDVKFYLDHKFPLDPKPIQRKQKNTKQELKNSTVRTTERPVSESQPVKDEAYLHQVEDHFGSTYSIILPGSELESLLFMKIASSHTDNSIRMKYADGQGLVIEFDGSKSREGMLRDNHKDFKKDVYNAHIKLMDQNEGLIAQNAIQNILDNNDNVLVRYVPEDDTINIVGINKVSTEEAEIKILEYLGQRTETEQPSDMKNIDPAVKRKQKEESVNGSREYSKRHHTESEQRLIKNNLPSRSVDKRMESSDINAPQLPPRDIGSHKINRERQEEQGKTSHLYVKIDRCGIADIKADYLVIPHSEQGHVLSERVFSEIDDNVRRELNHSVTTFGRFRSCECRKTDAGRLKVVHMCLDEDGDSGVTGNLLERALSEALWIAKDGPIVAVLLTALYDMSKFSWRHAEQFFDAIVSFSKATTTESTATTREVHLLSHNGEHVGVAKQTFERMAVRQSVEKHHDWFLFQRTPIAEISHKAKSVELNVEKVKILIDKGDVAEVSADGIVCIQDIDLSCSGETAQKIFSLCGDGYRQAIEDKRQDKLYIGEILTLKIQGGDITVKYVMNVFLPEVEKDYYESYTAMLKGTVTAILQKTEELGLTSLAIPFLQPGEEDMQADISLIRACCKGMYSAINRYFKNNGQSCLKRLDILVKDEGILAELKKSFQATVTDIW